MVFDKKASLQIVHIFVKKYSSFFKPRLKRFSTVLIHKKKTKNRNLYEITQITRAKQNIVPAETGGS